MVEDEEVGDVVVVPEDGVLVREEVGNVGDGGGRPAPALVVELGKALGTSGEGVAGRGVLYSPPSLKQQGAEPPVLTLLGWGDSVMTHEVTTIGCMAR